MLRTGIAQFVGSWVSESGYRLHIRRVRKDQASVDFLDPRGAPIGRPYMGGAPSMRMIAHYDNYYGDFRVDLWKEDKGFTLHLDHEYDYVLDSLQREALVPAISRYERDHFLDAYYSLFGPLDHFVRSTEQPRRVSAPDTWPNGREPLIGTVSGRKLSSLKTLRDTAIWLLKPGTDLAGEPLSEAVRCVTIETRH